MGTRGPIGKKNAEKAGHRTKAELARTEVIDLDELEIPEELLADAEEWGRLPANDEWHEIAIYWYEALEKSGQTIFFQPSDWATAYLICESLSRDLNPQFVGMRQVGESEQEAMYEIIPLKGASLAAYLKAFGSLMVTEGDRRRLGAELERKSKKGQTTEPADGDGVVLDRRSMFQQKEA
jgi:hypothetical protein